MGVSLSGLGAYEQMVIGRVILYDRIYYHHKVRSAESMVRTLIAVAQDERQTEADFNEFFTRASDDSFIAILGGELRSDYLPSGHGRSRAISDALLSRRMYHRAYAFAVRFIDGLDGLGKEEKRNSLQLLWANVLNVLNDSDGFEEIGLMRGRSRRAHAQRCKPSASNWSQRRKIPTVGVHLASKLGRTKSFVFNRCRL
jgi:hypothetical protein